MRLPIFLFSGLQKFSGNFFGIGVRSVFNRVFDAPVSVMAATFGWVCRKYFVANFLKAIFDECLEIGCGRKIGA